MAAKQVGDLRGNCCELSRMLPAGKEFPLREKAGKNLPSLKNQSPAQIN